MLYHFFNYRSSYMKEGASGMSVIEIGYPSGFSADPKSVSSHLLLKRVEEGDKKIGKDELCFRVTMERVGLVAGAQPVPVKVYDYYEPGRGSCWKILNRRP
ncbi:C3 and PZP-like alpha-2-macroglobulin domain-containing protein 8 [Dreissena polymorpha]|uniref:C3 and PZP-like alpha-2-macroglobulin domain-containing protein 8 n=1 Tax=Dreissena polymorpha TaxID=45954 RepID=UPI002263BB08|nr:C3 and PZP-like alpha-2-macroglobulin domain-containing protein 8 [Dreissena polymorpha]